MNTLGFICLPLLFLFAGTSTAAEWSDTAIGWRTGQRFAEPHNRQLISKNIVSLTHASGYRYGNQFLNIDVLRSDHHDPRTLGGHSGATEAYLTYRYTFDMGKIRNKPIDFGPIKGVGFVLGADLNYKTDVGYNSRKRMLALGPQLMWKVPGRLNSSLLMT